MPAGKTAIFNGSTVEGGRRPRRKEQLEELEDLLISVAAGREDASIRQPRLKPSSSCASEQIRRCPWLRY